MHIKPLFILFIVSIFFTACQPSPEQCADHLLNEAQTLVDNGSWNQAMLLLDSIHTTYPRLVSHRRQAKALADSVGYLEAQRTLAYTDTVLPPLLEQVDVLIKNFKFEKNENYEDHGRYVHRLLVTNSNTSRNFIQAYVRDDRQTIVKSYYYGGKSVGQQSVMLQANGEEQVFSGSNHHFESEGHHEIMTLENDPALAFLNFISTHQQGRVRVEGKGNGPLDTWVYYLTEQEKQALSHTYQLGWLMKDIKQIEQMQNVANNKILHYQQKNNIK
jgi:hypothetical protein